MTWQSDNDSGNAQPHDHTADRQSRRRAPCTAGTARPGRRAAAAEPARRRADRHSRSGASSWPRRAPAAASPGAMVVTLSSANRHTAISANPSSMAFRRPMRAADDARRQRADHAADRPRDHADGHILGPEAEPFGAVQREPRRERLKGQLQQERRQEDRPHPRHLAAHGRPRGIEERSERGLGGVRLRRGRLAKARRRTPRQSRARCPPQSGTPAACRASGPASGTRSPRRTSGT